MKVPAYTDWLISDQGKIGIWAAMKFMASESAKMRLANTHGFELTPKLLKESSIGDEYSW